MNCLLRSLSYTYQLLNNPIASTIMSGKKIITIFGATGGQGGGIVSTFLNDPKLKGEWAVRGVTRDVTKESAKKLAAQGVEVVAVSNPIFHIEG